MLDPVLKTLRMLPRELRWRWAAMPPVALVLGALEAGAAASVLALVMVLRDPAAAGRIPLVSSIAPHLPWPGEKALIVQLACLAVAYQVVKGLAGAAAQYLRHRVLAESSASLACAMLKGYLLAPYPFHFRRDSAELIRNTITSVNTVFLGVMAAAVAIVSELAVTAAIIAVLLAAEPVVTLLAGTAVAALLAVLLRLTRSMARRLGDRTHELNRTMLQAVQHALGGIKEIKALGREEYFYRAFAEKQRAMLELGQLGVTVGAMPQLLVETVFVGGALLVIALVTAFGASGADGLPVLALFAYAAFRIIPAANRLTWRLNEVRAGASTVDALHEDFLLVGAHEFEAAGPPGEGVRLRTSIALEGVAYAYPGAAPVLRDVRVTIRRGEAVGIVGPSGVGKSTLVDLIVGLLAPTEGRILVDGADIAGRTRSWRRHIGYVPQSIFLVDDTIARNIALGIPDAEIDGARIARAARLAQLEPLLASLPEGAGATVGECGARLSGGERQRVGIARALYHDPDVLVLDEATSALDNVTEAGVARAIESLHGEKTVLVIAHRLSTVRRCDRLLVVRGGTVASEGTYDDLLARDGSFAEMVAAEESGGAGRGP